MQGDFCRAAMNDKRSRDGAPARARGFAWLFFRLPAQPALRARRARRSYRLAMIQVCRFALVEAAGLPAN
jgi:hypothetical protein